MRKKFTVPINNFPAHKDRCRKKCHMTLKWSPVAFTVQHFRDDRAGDFWVDSKIRTVTRCRTLRWEFPGISTGLYVVFSMTDCREILPSITRAMRSGIMVSTPQNAGRSQGKGSVISLYRVWGA